MPFIPYGYYWHHIFDVLKNGNYENKKKSKKIKIKQKTCYTNEKKSNMKRNNYTIF